MENKQKQEQLQLSEPLINVAVKNIFEAFLSTRGSDDSEYADWHQLREPLLACLSTTTPPRSSSTPTSPLQILIPGCGWSLFPEHLYDSGFNYVTYIHFSRAVIQEMLDRNVRLRTEMKWRVDNMTNTQYRSETFSAVLDKGGLDGLMESDVGPKLCNQYLSEVMRLLHEGGKFICLTLGKDKVLGTLFPKFRYGWRVTVQSLPQKPSDVHSLLTFMVIAEKDSSSVSYRVDFTNLPSKRDQVYKLLQAIETENNFREKNCIGPDIWPSLKDLKLGGKDLKRFSAGQRFQLTIGGKRHSRFAYRAVLLDSRAWPGSDSFPPYGGRVFLVPATRAHDWIFTSEEGQWIVHDRSGAGRLIMVFLDSGHTISNKELQEDLAPLVKQLETSENMFGADVIYWGIRDEFKKHKLVHQAKSPSTGPIIVDEVVYENYNKDYPSKNQLFRRLTVQSSQKYIQSQALMKREESLKVSGEKQLESTHSSKSKKRGNQKKNEPHTSQTNDSSYGLKVDHDYLDGVDHAVMISGFALISSYLERMASTGQSVKATIIGLRAGVFPMFLRRCLPFMRIKVVEIDRVVQELARRFFSFKEDEHLKVHIGDGILFIKEAVKFKAAAETSAGCENEDAGCSAAVKSKAAAETSAGCKNEDAGCSAVPSVSCESSSIEVGEGSNSVDILIVDVDSYDSSSGLTCPSADFVEESFLLTVKDFISEDGLFIMNLLSKSPTVKDLVMSRIKTVFGNLQSLEVEDGVHYVIFALNTEVATCINYDFEKLKKLLKLNNPIIDQLIIAVTN